jgi:hypothetical protein
MGRRAGVVLFAALLPLFAVPLAIKSWAEDTKSWVADVWNRDTLTGDWGGCARWAGGEPCI